MSSDWFFVPHQHSNDSARRPPINDDLESGVGVPPRISVFESFSHFQQQNLTPRLSIAGGK